MVTFERTTKIIKEKKYESRTIINSWVVVAVIIGTGWVQNIIKLSDCDFESPYKTEVIRVIGILPPVGVVVGWMDIGEENVGD